MGYPFATPAAYSQDVSGTFETRPAGRRSWVVAAAAAFLGWLFVVLLLALGLRPLGLALGFAGVCALTVATLYGLARKLRPVELMAYAFARIQAVRASRPGMRLGRAIGPGGPPRARARRAVIGFGCYLVILMIRSMPNRAWICFSCVSMKHTSTYQPGFAAIVSCW